MKNKFYQPKPKQVIMLLFCFLAMQITFAQVKPLKKIKSQSKELHIAFEAAHWDTTAQKAEFITYKGVKAMKIAPGNKQVILKDFNFTNGTIEFDAEPVDVTRSAFLSVYFRQESPAESEIVYLRCKPDESQQRNDAVQYAPILHSINLWDIMGHYQAPASINNKDWNHIKLIVSGLQMKVYINDMAKPALEIPRLEGSSSNGTIAFDGNAYFANLVVKPGLTEALSPLTGADLTNHDINYIRRWDVTLPRFVEPGQELTKDDMPTDTTKWKPVTAERLGLINLTRAFGGVENKYGGVQDKNRFVWLKTTIHSTKEQVARIQLGFSDDVYVFINGGLLYVDKNQYPQPIMKYPDGRLNVANSSFDVPLKQGDNQLMVRVSNYFYGWGLVARMVNMDGIAVLQK